MLRCPWNAPASGAAPDAACRRFAAALACSLLVHWVFSVSVTPGGARAVRAGDAPASPIEARIVIPEPPLTASPVDPAHAAEPREPPAPPPRVEKKSRVTAPAVTEPAKTDVASGVAHAPDPTYYPARQLDVYPVLTTPLDLRYGAKGAADDVTGRVLLLVMIDHHGAVDAVNVVEAQPPGMFEDDARRAFLGARFRPALKDGRAVKARVLVHVSYGESAR